MHENERRPAASTGDDTPEVALNGGKHYLARRIVALMPSHLTYCEPYAGGLSVLLAKSFEGISEVINDVSQELCNFWRVLQDEQQFGLFARAVSAVPFSEHHWQSAQRFDSDDCTSAVTRAVAFFVLARQSLAGRLADPAFAAISKTRTRRGMNEQVSAWLSAVEGLPAVHTRLKRVLILNRDALDVICQLDHPQTLYYCDPTYLHETRTTTSDYQHEMTPEQHATLLDTLAGIQGKFLLSGYRSTMYDDAARKHGWKRVDIEVANHASAGKRKRTMTECVWLNYDPAKESLNV
jgi:DNA adenine methylase